MEAFGFLSSLFTIIGVGYSVWSWMRVQRRERIQAEKIEIFFVDAESRQVLYEFPYAPRRSSVSRAEVMGQVGMVPKEGTRLNIRYTSHARFMEQIDRIQGGLQDSIEIPLEGDELAQFGFNAPDRADS